MVNMSSIAGVNIAVLIGRNTLPRSLEQLGDGATVAFGLERGSDDESRTVIVESVLLFLVRSSSRRVVELLEHVESFIVAV